MLTTEQCKRRLFKIGLKLGVSPKLISIRLLSKDDKEDMLRGLIPDETLEIAVKCWMEAGTPDYANGHTERYRPSCDLPMNRGIGVAVKNRAVNDLPGRI